VAVLDPVRGILLHLGEHVADDFGRLVRRPLRARGVDGDVGERGPRQGVVEVVFHEIVLRQVGEVRLLHVGEVGWA
jgi:hypothetical protein